MSYAVNNLTRSIRSDTGNIIFSTRKFTYLHERLFSLWSRATGAYASVSPILQRHGSWLTIYQVSGRVVFGVVPSVGAGACSKIWVAVSRVLIFRAACCRVFFVYHCCCRLLHKKICMGLFLATLWNRNHLLLRKSLWRGVSMAARAILFYLSFSANSWTLVDRRTMLGILPFNRLGREICLVLRLQLVYFIIGARRCVGQVSVFWWRLNDEIVRVFSSADAVYILFEELSTPERLLIELRVVHSYLLIVMFHWVSSIRVWSWLKCKIVAALGGRLLICDSLDRSSKIY